MKTQPTEQPESLSTGFYRFKGENEVEFVRLDRSYDDTAMITLTVIMALVFGSLFGVILFIASLFVSPLGLP